MAHESAVVSCMVPAVQRWRSRNVATGQPPVDLFETDCEVIIELEYPRLDLRNVNVTVTDRTLLIENQADRHADAFTRSLVLPCGVRNDRVSATYNDGILEIRVPKLPPLE